MLRTYRNVGQKLSLSITGKILRGSNTVTRLNTQNIGAMNAGQTTKGNQNELSDALFRPYIMCGSSKLGDGSVCGP